MQDAAQEQAALTPSKLTLTGLGPRRADHWLGALVLVIALVCVGAAYLYWRTQSSSGEPQYRTDTVARGNLIVTVTATGSLQPTNKVDVGSELSGTIETVLVDDNDRVKKGQVLARLDLSRLKDQVARSRATLEAAAARVAQTQATVKEAQATLDRLHQVSALSGGKVPSQAEMSTAEAALARAHADEASARAAVSDASAAVRADETNVSKASIRSPIDGVVLTRKVDPGQTVAASLQAPVMFSLAEDLRQMQLQVDVDEADVGQLRDGQKATFTVDAYPGRRYPAKVIRVGLGSQIKDNVVTYPTLLDVDNGDLTLRPGMTATAEITTLERANALLVPNAALRFIPPERNQASAESSGGFAAKLVPRMPRSPPRKATTVNRSDEQHVYVLRDGQPVAIAVTTGASDGRHTEIVKGDLTEGAAVIVEAVVPAK